MEHRRQHERPGDEERLSGQRHVERPPACRWELVAADPAGSELADVVDEPPLEREQAVQQPHVQVLEPMVPAARLPGRKAQQRASGLDVRIQPFEVRVGVMQHVVLEAPEE